MIRPIHVLSNFLTLLIHSLFKKKNLYVVYTIKKLLTHLLKKILQVFPKLN